MVIRGGKARKSRRQFTRKGAWAGACECVSVSTCARPRLRARNLEASRSIQFKYLSQDPFALPTRMPDIWKKTGKKKNPLPSSQELAFGYVNFSQQDLNFVFIRVLCKHPR